MKIQVIHQRDLENVQRLMREWQERTQRVMGWISYQAALYVFHEIRSLLPTDPAYRIYRNSFRVVGVVGEPLIFAVEANPRAPKVKKIDAKKTVIYIKPRIAGSRASPLVYVLRKWGPWTVETLPIMPPRTKAKVEYRQVSASFVQRVASRNREQRRLWRRTLAKVGRRSMSSKMTEFPRQVNQIADFALDAFRLEFGMNGAKSRPHWRPALRKLARQGMRVISQNAHLIATLTDMTYQGWRSWRTPTIKVGRSDAQNFAAFQQRLGVFK